MDPRDRADAALARARARGRNIVTPDNMTSPMDSSDTQQIPRTLVNAVDPRVLDPESTMILPGQMAGGQAAGGQMQARPQQQQQRPQQPGMRPQGPQAPPTQPMPTQPMPVAEADVTQVVQPGVVPTVSHHPTTRPSLSQRLDG